MLIVLKLLQVITIYLINHQIIKTVNYIIYGKILQNHIDFSLDYFNGQILFDIPRNIVSFPT